MDVNKIFEFFKSEGETNETTQVVLEGPVLWIGMFKKLIINYNVFSKQLINMFSQIEPPLDTTEIENASGYMVYMRAFDYISRIDTSDEKHIECLKLYSDKYLEQSLKNSIRYYENIEEYEKCAVLKKINDIIISFQK